jgi:lysophospholipase L1-like esterase
MNWETLLSFGDSITAGARSYLGYPEICGDILGRHLDKHWHVINHAVNGYTTMDLVKSMNPLLENYKGSFPSLVTVMIGTNDIKNKVSTEEFMVAYRQLVIKLRLLAINDNVLLLKIPRFTQKVFYPYHFSMNEQVSEFNSCIESIAAAHQLRCLEFDFSDDDFFDGVHLNAKGSHAAGIQLARFILNDKGFEGTAALS